MNIHIIIYIVPFKDVGASIPATAQDGGLLIHGVLKFIYDRTVSRVRQHAKYYRSLRAPGPALKG